MWVLFVIVKYWKWFKFLLIREWINKLIYNIYIFEYYIEVEIG